MIPKEKQAAVKKALKTAFNTDTFDHIVQLTKGLSSALVFKIIVQERSYLLRVVTRADALGDPSFYYGCMKVAAEKELAPGILYMSIEDRISITDFVNEQRFSIDMAKVMLPRLLHRLHDLPKFPFRLNYFERMQGFIPQFEATKIFDEKKVEDLLNTYHRILDVYPINDVDNWVSCHNDCKPENIVFDGKRPWLVDWEAAFLNDRYLDLAIIANFIVHNHKEEEGYLESYFDSTVNDYQRARFLLMQQILHFNYFVVLLAFDNGPKPITITSTDNRNFRNFHDGMWNGTISLSSTESKREYAMLHYEQFQLKSQSNRFEDSLKIVANRQ